MEISPFLEVQNQGQEMTDTSNTGNTVSKFKKKLHEGDQTLALKLNHKFSERFWNQHPWRYSDLTEHGPEQPALSWLCSEQEIGQDDLWISFPTYIIL